MKLSIRILKGLGMLIALGVTVNLILVVVNWKDAPPSQMIEEIVIIALIDDVDGVERILRHLPVPIRPYRKARPYP